MSLRKNRPKIELLHYFCGVLEQFRNSAFVRSLWGLMALYLLNISVDTADRYPDHIPEDLSFNDQESIVEIVVEKILRFENAIAEYDDHDTEAHNKKKPFKANIQFYWPTPKPLAQGSFTESGQGFPLFDMRLLHNFVEIDTPPPKA